MTVYINNSGSKRRVKKGTDSNKLLLDTVLRHKESLPNKFKRWMTNIQLISFFEHKGVIADIWGIRDFIYFVNFRAEDSKETTMYIEDGGGCIRFRGREFPITKEEEEWRAIDEETEYYTFLPTKIIEEQIDEIEIPLDITDPLEEEAFLPFNKKGIILYSQAIPDKMKRVREMMIEQDILKEYTLVKVRTEVLKQEGIKFFMKGANRGILFTDKVLRSSFSEINVASDINLAVN